MNKFCMERDRHSTTGEWGKVGSGPDQGRFWIVIRGPGPGGGKVWGFTNW